MSTGHSVTCRSGKLGSQILREVELRSCCELPRGAGKAGFAEACLGLFSVGRGLGSEGMLAPGPSGQSLARNAVGSPGAFTCTVLTGTVTSSSLRDTSDIGPLWK